METPQLMALTESGGQTKNIQLGEVASVDAKRGCMVRLADDGAVVPCDVLQTSDVLPLRLVVGDEVLVWQTETKERGVVMGRVGASKSPKKREKSGPDELTIEAKQNLVLRCGDGSITLRNDGKILIKGKDLVSRAKRLNRIKGGSVAIN